MAFSHAGQGGDSGEKKKCELGPLLERTAVGRFAIPRLDLKQGNSPGTAREKSSRFKSGSFGAPLSKSAWGSVGPALLFASMPPLGGTVFRSGDSFRFSNPRRMEADQLARAHELIRRKQTRPGVGEKVGRRKNDLQGKNVFEAQLSSLDTPPLMWDGLRFPGDGLLGGELQTAESVMRPRISGSPRSSMA